MSRRPVVESIDSQGTSVRVGIRATALARTVQALGESFVLDLNSETKFVRVYAIAKDVYVRWAEDGEDYCKPDNFDEVVIAGQYIDLAIPVQPVGTLYNTMTFVGRESGATVIVIEK